MHCDELKNLVIRKALSEDKVALLALEQKIIAAERPYDQSIKSENAIYYDVSGLIADDASCLSVAEFDGVIVGTGYAQIRESQKSFTHARHSYLGFMYVEPGCRGLGINRLIMENLMAWSKEQGVPDVYLEVYDGNEMAKSAYAKLGFTNSLVEMKINLSE